MIWASCPVSLKDMLAEPGWDRGSTATAWPDAPVTVRRQKRRRSDRPLFGILLLAVGVVWLLNVTVVNLTGETILSALLILLGLGMVFTGRAGGRRWPIVVGLLLTLALIGNSKSFNLNVPTGGGFGDRPFAPLLAADVQPTYRLGAGKLSLDLSQLPAGEPITKTIVASDGFGEILITLSPGATVDVTAKVAAGNFRVFDQRPVSGVGIHEHYRSPGFSLAKQQFTLVVKAGAASISVVYAAAPCVAAPMGTCNPTPVTPLTIPPTPVPQAVSPQ